jgi:formylglycine-generating enzyme required for sulfatase activity
MKFVKIPAGTFMMGSNGLNQNEQPVHYVTISSAFYMATTTVTQKQWRAVMGNNPSYFKGANRPVENVSWDDAQEFIERMNQREPDKGYRLPTEAEWEYACRAGTTGECYGDLDAIAWYDGNSGGATHPVGQKQPNAWGLYDMNGNVWQWCQDWFGENYYGSSPATDPQGPSMGPFRVFRGGAWSFLASCVRSANRSGFYPGGRTSLLGFRLVRTSP